MIISIIIIIMMTIMIFSGNYETVTAACPLGSLARKRPVDGWFHHGDGDGDVTFTRVAGACEAPEVLSAMVAVDWRLVALLDKAGDDQGHDHDHNHHDNHHHHHHDHREKTHAHLWPWWRVVALGRLATSSPPLPPSKDHHGHFLFLLKIIMVMVIIMVISYFEPLLYWENNENPALQLGPIGIPSINDHQEGAIHIMINE